MNEHDRQAAIFSDEMIEVVLADIERRGRALADYRNHEMRWLSGRAKALRAERRRRKGGARG